MRFGSFQKNEFQKLIKIKLQKFTEKQVSEVYKTSEQCQNNFQKCQDKLKKFVAISLQCLQLSETSQLTLSLPEKLENSIFKIPIIPQTLNINNLENHKFKFCHPEYHQKAYQILLSNVLVKAMVTLTIFKILLFKARAQRVPRKPNKKNWPLLEFLGK